jgi:hypothetical protein
MSKKDRRAADQGRDAKETAKRQDRKLGSADTPQDVTSTRAKSERKGKVTADKWNQ